MIFVQLGAPSRTKWRPARPKTRGESTNTKVGRGTCIPGFRDQLRVCTIIAVDGASHWTHCRANIRYSPVVHLVILHTYLLFTLSVELKNLLALKLRLTKTSSLVEQGSYQSGKLFLQHLLTPSRPLIHTASGCLVGLKR